MSKQQTAQTDSTVKSQKATASGSSGCSSQPANPVDSPEVKLASVFTLPGSSYMAIQSLTPTWDASHLLVVLSSPVLSEEEGTSLLTGDSAKEARLRSIWDDDAVSTAFAFSVGSPIPTQLIYFVMTVAVGGGNERDVRSLPLSARRRVACPRKPPGGPSWYVGGGRD